MAELNRKKTFLLGTVSNYGSLLVSTIVGLVSVPVGLSYFGPTVYGIWLVIASVVAYLRMSDFGIGLATLVLISHEPGAASQRLIFWRSIKVLVTISIVCIALTLVIATIFPNWIALLGKIPPGLHEQVRSAVIATVILLFLQLPTIVFSVTFSGLQKVYWERIYGAFYSGATLIALIATILVKGNLVTLAFFTGLGGIIVGVISGVHLLTSYPGLLQGITTPGDVLNAPSPRVLFASGLRFFILQVSAVIIFNTDNLVISHFLGPEKVTPYAVTFKLFQMGLLTVNVATSVLWPMYGRAFAEGNWEWIQQTYNRCVTLLVKAGGFVWAGGVVFSEFIIKIWAGPQAYGGLLVAFVLGGYVFLSSFGGANASLINGINPTNIVVVFGVIEALLNLTFSLIFVRYLGIGGVALGTCLASLLITSWFPPLYVRWRTGRKVNLQPRPVLTHALLVVLPCVVLALVAALKLQQGLSKFIVGMLIMGVYLIVTWLLMPEDLRSVLRNITTILKSKAVDE